MSIFKKILALICVFALLTGILAGCSDEEEQTPTTEATTNGSADGQFTSFVVNLKSAGGLPLSGVTLFVYSDETLTDLEGYGQTNADGQAVIRVAGSGSGCYLVVSDAPEGYQVEASYPLTGTNMTVELTSQVIADTDLSGVSYKLGSVMHDFTVTDSQGNSHTLSELLKQKDMVMLNFWYTTCTYCVQEFPYMDSTYREYADSIEIIALNPYTSDTAEDVAYFKDSFYETYPTDEKTTGGLAFPMAKDENMIANCFEMEGFPTSVIIDRYGVITMIHSGGLVDEDYFHYIYNAFVGEEYTQKLYTSIDELMPEIKPNLEMPTSEEISNAISSGQSITYAAETDPEAAEFTWPFVIGEKEGKTCIYAPNAGIIGSYATIYATVSMKAGQALAMDYFASSEENADILYVLVDRNDVYQISGQSSQWNTCYPWVATEDGEYEVALCYLKDTSEDAGDDTVYISDLRLVDVSDIDTATYIPKFAATNLNEDGFGYQNYITTVYNSEDGYYHVNSADGPLLLANLMMATRFSNDPIWSLADSGKIVVDGVNYYDELVRYCSYASNSQIYSMVPVTEELKGLLQKVTAAVGIEQTENEWLQICEYYDAYGTDGKQLADPTAGLSAHSAFTAKLGKNSVTYDRALMPRGLFAKFVPDKSGVYRITSVGDAMTEGWVFTEQNIKDRAPFYTYWFNERAWTDPNNVSMLIYMEKGKEYFIDIAYYDMYAVGTIEYTIEYEAKELEYLSLASPGYFTYYDENTYDTVTGGIEIALGEDGYYHEKLADGSLGSVLYVDMVSYSSVFNNHSLLDLINSGTFNFALTSDDEWILDYYEYFEERDFNGTDFETCMKEVWGDRFEANWELLKVDEVLDGIYHGDGKDMTSVAKQYANKIAKSGDLKGCVAVNEELAELLQMLMDKHSFEGIENSWIKMCYYYDYVGPDSNK